MSENEKVISDEAVEVVARWLWARDSNDIVEGPRPRWGDLATSGVVWKAALEDTRQEARELLEAAAPYVDYRGVNLEAVRAKRDWKVGDPE